MAYWGALEHHLRIIIINRILLYMSFCVYKTFWIICMVLYLYISHITGLYCWTSRPLTSFSIRNIVTINDFVVNLWAFFWDFRINSWSRMARSRIVTCLGLFIWITTFLWKGCTSLYSHCICKRGCISCIITSSKYCYSFNFLPVSWHLFA